MELDDLRIFKTVAEEGGILKASRKLHRVQSNVSTRIRQLESSIGTLLFHRERQRLVLSAAGETLLEYADRLLRLAAEARSALSGSRAAGVIKLGSLESTAASRLPEILSAYHRDCPDVAIELVTGTNDALTAAVARRELDAAFVAEKPSVRTLASMPLFSERLVIICALGHRRIEGPRDIDGDSVIAFPNGCAYRRILQRWLGTRRLPTLRVLELSSYHAIVACVASGSGIALVPESVLDTIQHQHIAIHPLPKVYANVTTPFIWRSGERSAALDALHDTLRESRATGQAGRG
jgi:DNA-binding transcriptional LysR family regulator